MLLTAVFTMLICQDAGHGKLTIDFVNFSGSTVFNRGSR
jgi:hypothetical protein